ncbi:MAG: A24 family peptidase [Beijerinckiaceae bacterium]
MLMSLILLCLLPLLFIYACFSDLFEMRISNRTCLAVLALFLTFAGLSGMPLADFGWHLLAGFAVLVISFTLFSFGWIGGGDAKLVAAVAVWLGFGQLWEYVAISSILGGMLTLGLLVLRRHPLPSQVAELAWVQRLHSPTSGIPYGIALGIAALMLLPHSTAWQALI